MGKEVIQLYLSDDFASMIPNGKSLKRFSKTDIPGNDFIVKTFTLSKEDFMFVGPNGNFIVEDGTFTIGVGPLRKTFHYHQK